jgi:hypothetical protein
MLVGAHAYGALLHTLGVKPRRNYATENIDNARYPPIQRAAVPEGGLLEILHWTGLPFVEVPEFDSRRPSTSFLQRGTKLKVNLLMPSKGATFGSVRVPELKAHATKLPYLGFLLAEQLETVILSRDRVCCPVKLDLTGQELSGQSGARSELAAAATLHYKPNTRRAFSPCTRSLTPSPSASTRARHPIGSPMVCG